MWINRRNWLAVALQQEVRSEAKVQLVRLDQVFGLPARAIDLLIDMLGRARLGASNDKADVEALGCSLNSGAGAAIGFPGFGPIAGLSEAAQTGILIERAAGPSVVGDFIDQPVEDCIAGQAKDEVDPILIVPLHDLRATVMAIAADGDAGLWPVPADATDETAQVTAHLVARGCLAGAQQHGDRSARRCVVDMDRQEASARRNRR